MANHFHHCIWESLLGPSVGRTITEKIDPLDRPTVTAGSDYCFWTYRPYVRPSPLFMFATGETVGLAEWIIDETCLVLTFCNNTFYRQFFKWKFPMMPGNIQCSKNFHLYSVYPTRSFSFYKMYHLVFLSNRALLSTVLLLLWQLEVFWSTRPNL